MYHFHLPLREIGFNSGVLTLLLVKETYDQNLKAIFVIETIEPNHRQLHSSYYEIKFSMQYQLRHCSMLLPFLLMYRFYGVFTVSTFVIINPFFCYLFDHFFATCSIINYIASCMFHSLWLRFYKTDIPSVSGLCGSLHMSLCEMPHI